MRGRVKLLSRLGLFTGTLFALFALYADDVNVPPWRGKPDSTFQHWEFSTAPDNYPPPKTVPPRETDPMDPEHVKNPYDNPDLPPRFRKPQARGFNVDSPYTEWLEGHRARTGVWRLDNHGEWTAQLEFTVPNKRDDKKVKDVWVQVTYDDVTGKPVVGLEMPPAPGSSAFEDVPETAREDHPTPLHGGWKHSTYKFTAPRCPPFVVVTIEAPAGRDKVVYVDQAVIDTYCYLPELPKK